MAGRRDLARPARHDDRPDRRGLADRGGARLPGRGDVLRPAVRPRNRRRAVRVADDLARPRGGAPRRRPHVRARCGSGGRSRRRGRTPRRSGHGRGGRLLGGRRARHGPAMTETGTRDLADGRPGYRLVRREDVELAPALPGRSSGLTTCRLVDGTLGSTHMALTLASLAAGHVDEHLHSFETSFYVLEGEPVLYLEGRGVRLRPAACGAIPVGTRHAFRSDKRARWIEMASPRPRIDGSDTFFLGPAPETDAE